MSVDRTDRLERFFHFDNLLWQVSSILLAANGVIINAYFQGGSPEARGWLPWLGYILTIATVYFAASFRKYGELYKAALDELLTDDEKKEMDKGSLRQWGAYVLLIGLFGIFWSRTVKIPKLSNEDSIFPALISMAIILICLYKRGVRKEKAKKRA